MSNHTFTPGQRVSDQGKGLVGTVADDPAMTAEYPGMIPVHWDNGDRSVASPAILAFKAHHHQATEITLETEDAECAALRAARAAGLWPNS